MAFNIESEYLDLKKVIQDFQYVKIDSTLEEKIKDDVQLGGVNTYLQLQDKEILLSDIKNICLYFKIKFIMKVEDKQVNALPFHKIKNRVCCLIQKYQEQPVLLDEINERILNNIFEIINSYLQELLKDQQQPNQEFHDLAEIIYILSKVCSFNHIQKYFPHSVHHLEPILYVLQDSRNSPKWETHIALLLVLSVLVMVPFDFSTLDSDVFKESLDKTIISVCKAYLSTSNATKGAASIAISKLFCRADMMKTNYLNDYIDWGSLKLQEYQDDVLKVFGVIGYLNGLFEIFKIGQRAYLLPFIEKVIAQISKVSENNSHVKLFKCKVMQRMALIYLRPRVVDWAYQKPRMLLSQTLTQSEQSEMCTNTVHKNVAQQTNKKVEAQDINYYSMVNQETLENIIDYLLIQLKDKDTIVRWSSAKGIGRICSRLDLRLADDIISYLLENLFSADEGPNSWHGGSLALGELIRRGLILPSRLEQVLPLTYQGLVYDDGTSQSISVRDAGCYVVWALARAYEPNVLTPYVNQLASYLLLTCLFDREVNCRRAAAAAFQEHVGRQGYFPHGIPILTEADYFSVGVRQNSYLNIGLFVSSYPEYFSHFVDHLSTVKLFNQDTEISRLTAGTLSLMTAINPEYFIENIIDLLCKQTTQDTLHVRLGAIYGLGDVIIGLFGLSKQHNFCNEAKDSVFLRSLTKNEKTLLKGGDYYKEFKAQYVKIQEVNHFNKVNQEQIKNIIETIINIDKQRLFRGKGGEFMRTAVCRLIECICMCKIQLSAAQSKKYYEIIEECLKNPLEHIQTSAVACFSKFCEAYPISDDKLKKLIENSVKDVIISVKRGFTRALGVLDKNTQINKFDQILDALKQNTLIKKAKEEDDADCRKFAIISLSQMNKKLGTPEELQKVLDIFINGLNDYTMDKRGDVGLYTREQSMVGFMNLFKTLIAENNQRILLKEQIEVMIKLMLQQLGEKIDRVRLLAGSCLQEFFDNYSQYFTDFDQKDELFKVFNKANVAEMLKQDQTKVDLTFQTEVIQAEIKHLEQNVLYDKGDYVYHWNLPHCVFQKIVPLLRFKTYSYNLLKGLIISIGGITESVVKHSVKELSQYIQTYPELSEQLLLDFLELFKNCQKDERVINPLMRTLSYVFERDEILNLINIEQLSQLILQSVQNEVKTTKSIHKLSSSIPLIVNLMNPLKKNYDEFKNLIFKLLLHEFPTLRKQTADKLYLFVSGSTYIEMFGDIKSEQFGDILLETEWLSEKLNLNQLKIDLEKVI